VSDERKASLFLPGVSQSSTTNRQGNIEEKSVLRCGRPLGILARKNLRIRADRRPPRSLRGQRSLSRPLTTHAKLLTPSDVQPSGRVKRPRLSEMERSVLAICHPRVFAARVLLRYKGGGTVLRGGGPR
jgi:hypothetical protein